LINARDEECGEGEKYKHPLTPDPLHIVIYSCPMYQAVFQIINHCSRAYSHGRGFCLPHRFRIRVSIASEHSKLTHWAMLYTVLGGLYI
jgi:hypothetical protein